ncbi:MAG TPA: hypothetical protein VGX28_01265 [Frankiaceae bacterium]|jgi:hypothetical protein|nr:hypothetical protein [Frankiaceae bacterium]
MTYLSYPRIAFSSANAVSNVSTANNQNVVDILDFDDVTLKNPTGLSPEEYRTWLMELCEVNQGSDAKPQWRRTMFGYWNYYGDQLQTFGDASVQSVLLPAAPEPDDLLATASVSLVARLVDLDPADTFTSQMFTSSFVVSGKDSEGQPVTLIDARQPTIASTRWLNFSRPYGAGSFWCVVPKERLAFAPRGTSKALDVLRHHVEAGDGVALRYVLYWFIAPVMTDEQVDAMRDAFLKGDYVLNAKIGSVVGTFGAWTAGEPVSAPGGAWLHPLGSPFIPPPAPRGAGDAAEAAVTLSAPDAPLPLSHGALDAHWDATGAAPAHVEVGAFKAPLFGPAAAVVGDGEVTLDLGTTFPEESKESKEKANVGTVTLYAGPTRIGDVDYSREAYERYGGVAVVKVPPGVSVTGPLSLRWRTDEMTSGLVAQQVADPYVVVDDQCTYLNLPDAQAALTVRVFDPDGAPLREPVTLNVDQWQDYTTPSTTTPGDPLPQVTPPSFKFRPVAPTDPARMVPSRLVVPEGGIATLPLKARQTGCYKIRLYPPQVKPEDPNAQTNGFQIDYWCAVRVLPVDDYSHVPDDRVTWEFVWTEVFAYYALMYPVMSQYVPWGPRNAPLDPDRVHTLAVVLRELVDERNAGTSMYMPVTRELSDGKRALIRRWCDLQLGIASRA